MRPRVEVDEKWCQGAFGHQAGSELWARLQGATSEEERAAAIASVQSPDERVMRLNRPQDRVMTPFPEPVGSDQEDS